MFKKITGYKVFDPEWKCRGFQYKVGETYRLHDEPKCCEKGFHFCVRLADCFEYYDFDLRNKVALVKASGLIDKRDNKICASTITIVRELSWADVLQKLNVGDYNTGRHNAGNYNSGDYNSGARNSGYYNVGNYNAGDWNLGGNNSGDCNNGRSNSGDLNTGDYNSGDRNTGDCNSGDWNTGDHNTGAFNTIEPEITLFNQPSGWTYSDWANSDAYEVMSDAPGERVMWVESDEMTNREKKRHPEYEVIGGYLKTISEEDLRRERQKWWDELAGEERMAVMSLPNFDPDIFEECTGIKVDPLTIAIDNE